MAASAVFVRSAALTGRGSLLNGTFMQHFGRNNNLGDIRAKLEVQGRWLALIALPTDSGVSARERAAADFVDDGDELSAFVAASAIYGVVIGVHVFACWQAAKSLRFDSLNRFRLLTLAEMFVANEDEELPDCVVVGDIEGVYKPRRTAQTPTFGASPSEIGQSWEDFTQAVFMAKGRPYVLGCDPNEPTSRRPSCSTRRRLATSSPPRSRARNCASTDRVPARTNTRTRKWRISKPGSTFGMEGGFHSTRHAPTFAVSASERARDDDDSTASPR